jgi:D-3-phosphoglycerate dehydrogenase / 2-oxoglutarate reductase
MVRAVFVDANETLSTMAEQIIRADGLDVAVNPQPALTPSEIPGVLGRAEIAIIDHTALPTAIAAQCHGLRHVVFLGSGARSYMNPEELQQLGITVHTIKGYGDTAVAEMAIGLMWAAAKGVARMDREMRSGNWRRTDGLQLTGKTLGLIGFGGIASEVARLALGIGMRIVAWNRSAKSHPGVEFISLERLLAESDVVSLHLLLTDETRGMLSRDRMEAMKPGAILVNTARGALVNEGAMIDGLRSGRLAHAALDVFEVEPLSADHPLTRLENVTLTAHSAFRTKEASINLLTAAREHCRRIVAEIS